MSIKLGDVIVFMKGDRRQLDKSFDQSEKRTKSWTEKVGETIRIGIGTAIGDMAMDAAGKVLELGAALVQMTIDALPIEGIRASFRGLTDDADATLKVLRDGALGMVTDTELMRGYNEAAQLVSKTFADQLPEAMRYFQKISASTGQSVDFLMDSYTKGIGRLQPLILDNLLVTVDMAEANQVWADKMGVSVEEMTKQEKQMALADQTLLLLAENTADMPDITDNAATSMAQFQTTLQNLRDMAGIALIPALIALLTPLQSLATEHGPMVIEWAQKLGAFIESPLAPVLIWLAEIVIAGVDALMNFSTALYQTYGATWSATLRLIGMDEAADKLLNTMGLLDQKTAGVTDTTKGSVAQLDAMTDATEDVTDVVDEAAFSMADLNTLMAGAVSHENKQYENQMASIKDRIANVTAELANLKDQQESPFAKSKQEKMLEAQIALQEKVAAEQEARANKGPGNQAKRKELALLEAKLRTQTQIALQEKVTAERKVREARADSDTDPKDLAKLALAVARTTRAYQSQVEFLERVGAEQEALADTEPGNQAKLELAVLRSTRAYQQKMQAVTEHGKQTEAEATRAAELTAELGTLQAQMVDLEAAHKKAMNQIVFDMATAEMAVDGFTEAEGELAEKIAESMGLIDRDTAEMVDGVNRSLALYDRNGIIEDAISAAFRLSNLYRTMPSPSIGGAGVPRYAAGTDFHPGGPAIVGEGKLGGELVDLPRGSRVTPTEQPGGGGGSQDVTMYGVTIYSNDAGDLFDQLSLLQEAV